MWIKISIAVALFSLLAWSAFKLFSMRRKEKSFRKIYQEPILSSINLSDDFPDEDEFVGEPVVVKKDLRAEQNDNDAALGLKSTAKVPLTKNVYKQPEQKSKKFTVIAIHLMAPKGKPYIGYELLQALLAAGLRFGDKNIFHRHENKNGTGPVLFHLASASTPGTFELAKMGGFSCLGLSLFMQLNDKVDNVMAFETLLDTANELISDLGGELWDEHYKNLTMDKITEYRLRIREYQSAKAHHLPDFFEQHQET